MDLNGYLAVLAAEATTLADAAGAAGLDAEVPTTPGWTVADLVLHVGEVHRWATATVASKATKLSDVPGDSRGPLPERADTITWFRDGAARLCETLAVADPSIEYAAFLHDPMTPRLLFWARRQTLETSMHRVDAESATGRCTGFAPDLAVDGIDEFLTGFLPRSRTTLHADAPRRLQVAPDYSDRRWTVTISTEMPMTTRSGAGAETSVDCCVSGSASDIYLALWNRGSLDPLGITGDASLINALRDNVRIRWG
ncbi:MAG: maleylpyruvate isomerase family mycothiol-dependent enzyme [Ilumatobacteraceae bacterium]